MASSRARIRVELVKVHCFDTEDNLGGDEFYVVGAAACGDIRNVVLTKPLDINDQQTKMFNPTESVIFEGEVGMDDTLTLGIAGYDEDFSSDWGKYGQALKEMLDSVNKVVPIPGQFGQQLIDVSYTAMSDVLKKIDPDDELGQLTVSRPISEIHAGDKPWPFEGGTWMGKWKYEVTYRITKIPVE
ncbi:hypothetical protein OG453_05710 [Streptomyces sp. NBC_01381]|uniref:hypothetical protein n=1 Tax=unclassified Streptomyces TaxID=2593676 RepID=UPI002252F6D8|nr:hypothetical protein [Streptomyces sp. NBC_01381]MCX4666162.1 hypothetical protein [Streptomyces sp. NBC_01381]